VTLGERGILAATADGARHVPGFPPAGPLDPVGAGDAVTAAVTCALAAGAAPDDAALFGVLVSSIAVERIGETGTATPEQVRARFAEYRRVCPQAE